MTTERDTRTVDVSSPMKMPLPPLVDDSQASTFSWLVPEADIPAPTLLEVTLLRMVTFAPSIDRPSTPLFSIRLELIEATTVPPLPFKVIPLPPQLVILELSIESLPPLETKLSPAPVNPLMTQC